MALQLASRVNQSRIRCCATVVGDLRWGPTSVLIYTPAVYGPRKTLYNCWVRWARQGVWCRAFAEIAAAGGSSAELMLDSSYARATKG
jgi:hypothetical protein